MFYNLGTSVYVGLDTYNFENSRITPNDEGKVSEAGYSVSNTNGELFV